LVLHILRMTLLVTSKVTVLEAAIQV